ncbi:hypothetical protein KR093_002826 [Drosophila rubida]|uniref:Tetraspanin n=1 Tax=Drosophila rubida TaxID=30044 RepID=A0AAD4PPW1_9MUSC|nr:hypothetical protein KR093_002826 [Drosophila rubida]
MNCCGELSKFLLLLWNLISMIFCIWLLIMVYPVAKEMKDIAEIKKYGAVDTVVVVTIVICSVILLLSLLGCCGALGGKPSQLRIYSFIMLVMFVAQVILVIYVWTHQAEIHDKLGKMLAEVWKNHKEHSASNEIQHNMERHLKCCGFQGFWNYKEIYEQIPPSCCGMKHGECHERDAYNKGCMIIVLNIWESYTKQIKYGALSASGIVFLASSFASYLAHRMRRDEEFVPYD